MILLSFDTALNKTYVTISKDGNVLTSKIIENTEDNYHSAFLISTIKEVLKENNLTPVDINLIGVNVGPGSFTGIRASLTVAKVMAQELNTKIVPVESLKILSKLNNTDKETLVTLDARRSMAYIYTDSENLVKSVTIEDLKNKIKEKEYFIISDKSISQILDLKSNIIFESENFDFGKILNKLAYDKRDTAITANELKALYIQPPPVFVKK